ncbi:MAG: primosomal protein N' (replication factor Y) - superfamily II helicase, partial [Gammaproteobacteria bacterium]
MQEQGERAATQHGFPCQQCGATLGYAPGTEFLRCSYCGFENEIGAPAGEISEQDFHAALEDAAEAQASEEHITVKCDSCAAEFDFDRHIHADECPFCGSTIVADTGRQRVIKPRSLLPFHISDREATALFQGWVKSLWFAPGEVKKYVRDEQKLMGMYVPYWTFDADTVSRYRGMRGDFYQVPEQYVATVNGKRVTRTRMVTRVRWTPAGGTVSRRFDDLLVLASHSL